MNWLKHLFSRRKLYGELSEEIREHLEEKIEDLVANGISREEATYAARRQFGNVTLIEEDSREVWRWPSIENLFMDVRFGARMLRRNPGFTVVAVATLALGIAANTTIFSAVRGWMLRPPKIKDPGSVVAILTTDPAKGAYGWDQNPVSAPDFIAWRAQSQSFEGMVAGEFNDVALTGEGEPEWLTGMSVSADYFQVLGVDAALGRIFLPGEDQSGHDHVVILSHGLWQGRFGSDRNVIGKSVQLNGESYTVTGVMPSHFRLGYDGPQLWTPLVFPPDRLLASKRSDRSLRVLARLKPGVSFEAANAEIATLAQRAEQTYPATSRGWGARAMVLQKYLGDEFKVAMRLQMGAVLLVLLIGCANIASLQLTRAAARQSEIAMRTALGASRLQLVRQLLIESLLIAFAGGGLGLLLACWGVGAFRRSLNWGDYVRLMANEITIDSNVLAFTLGISVVAAILFGLAPAFHQTAANLNPTLQEGGRTISQGRARRRAHGVLVTVQVALAIALLGGAGLDIWTFVYGFHAGFGIDPKHVLTANVRLSNPRYKDLSTQAAFFREAIEHLEALPGVTSAGGTTTLVARAEAPVVTFGIAGQAVLPRPKRPRTQYFTISPRFLDTLRVPLLRGRSFGPHDDAQAPPVALINQAFVRRFFPGDEPLGKHLRVDTGDSDGSFWSEIVGVVGNIKDSPEELQDLPQFYESYLQRPSSSMTLLVRTTSEPAGFAPLLNNAIWSIDKDQPVNHVQTMEQVIADSQTAGAVVTTMMGSFAGLALGWRWQASSAWWLTRCSSASMKLESAWRLALTKTMSSGWWREKASSLEPLAPESALCCQLL
jgi:Acidobacterial duplicated orphan permease